MKTHLADRIDDREVAMGTWAGIAVITDVLIQAGIVDRDAITSALSDALTAISADRAIPLQAILYFIARLSDVGSCLLQ